MSNHPKLYLRYIDDCFAVFDDDNACTSFLNTLNKQHLNIKFTIEKLTKTLQFLDVDIKINECDVDTWVWRKPTNTGLFLNFDSTCATKWKTALILCMLHRAKLICSSERFFHTEVNKLRSLFLANNYTTRFFNVLRRFLSSNRSDSYDMRTAVDDDKKAPKCEKLFVKVPYVGVESKRFVNRLSELIYRKIWCKVVC